MAELVSRSSQDFSKIVFGRGGRLDTWRAIMSHSVEPPEPFCVRGIFEALDRGAHLRNSVEQEFDTLVQLQMITPTKGTFRTDYPDSQHYHRLESPVWAAIAALEATFHS